MKDWGKVLTNLVYVGQLGLDLIVPSLMCLGAAWLLDSHAGWGIWVYFPALFLGIAAGALNFRKFCERVVMKGFKKKPDPDKPERITFSRHS